MTEVVGGEGRLEAFGGENALRLRHPRVVDEDVDVDEARGDPRGGAPHGLLAGEVGQLERDADSGEGRDLAQLRQRPLTPLPAAADHRDVSARAHQLGRIEREYGVGRRRMDLGIVWPVVGMSEQRAAIECKLIRSGSERAIRVGVEQTAAYMDIWGADEGHLAVFDRREGVSWEEKVFRRDETFGAHAITVWGM